MRAALTSISIVTLVAVATAWTRGPSGDAPSRQPQGPAAAMPDADVAGLLRYEPTGLSLLRPYRRGRVPVVFVHGLWSSPWSWSPMVEALEADPALRDRYQFWTFGYSTGDPILYSAWLLRRDLDEVRRKFDPDGTDAAFDRTVVVGHSMGGLLAKMMVQDSGPRLWRLVSDRPFEELAGDPEDRDLFRRALFFKPRPEVRRVVFIATPHRGSYLASFDLVRRLAAKLISMPREITAIGTDLVPMRDPTKRIVSLERFPTSIDNMSPGHPFIKKLANIPVTPAVTAHSIISVDDDSPLDQAGDGVVKYESAHIDGVVSERIIRPSSHSTQSNPQTIDEVRRILLLHAEENPCALAPPTNTSPLQPRSL